MMPTRRSPRSYPQRWRRLAALALLVLVLAAAVLLSQFASTPPPMLIDEQVGEATITFGLDRSQVILPDECVRVGWSVEGIRAVYFNGEPTVGTSEALTCPWDETPTLQVVFQDEQEKTYTLPVRVLSYTPLVWGLVAVIVGGTMGALALGLPGLAAATRRSIIRLAAAILTRAAADWRWLENRPLLLVGLLTLIGAALRLAHLNDHSLVLDEAAMWQITRGGLAETLQRNAAGNSAPPLFALLLSLWQLLGGRSELWLRLLPVVASTAAIPAMYALVRNVFDQKAAYFGALLVAFAAPQIEYAQYLREYSLTVLLTILALHAYLRLREGKRGGLWWVGIWAACLLTQYGLLLLVVALDALWTLETARRAERQQVLRWLAAQAVLVLVLGVVYFTGLRFQWAGGSGETWYSLFYWDGFPASLGTYITSGFVGLLRLAYGTDAALFGFGALGLAGLALILTRRRALLPLLCLPVLATLAAGLLGVYPYTGTRQMLFLTPIFVLAAAGGWSYLTRWRDEAPLRLLAGVALVAGVAGGFAGISTFYARPSFDQMRPVVETLNEARWQGDAVFSIPYAQPLLDYYYLWEQPENAATFTLARSSEAADYAGELDALRQQVDRVWLIVNCCDEGLREYFAARGEGGITPYARRGNVSMYLLAE